MGLTEMFSGYETVLMQHAKRADMHHNNACSLQPPAVARPFHGRCLLLKAPEKEVISFI